METPLSGDATGRRNGVTPGRPRNVIVIFSDQLRSFELGCYGNAEVNTPHIDALARSGTRFELGISNSPTCVPSRSNLLTGQYSRSCVGSRANEMAEGSFGRNDRKKHPDAVLPEILRGEGYATAIIGKWHIDTRPTLLGFDTSVIPTKDYYTKGSVSENEGASRRVPGFTTDYEIAAVRDYIREAGEEPFFLFYNITPPHMPINDVPYRYSHMYDPRSVSLRENVWIDGTLARDEQWFQVYLREEPFYYSDYEPVTAKIQPEFTLRSLTALYRGSVTWVDDLVGVVMSTLEERGLVDDTLVVFAADHGDQLGSHHLWNKARLYEESIRVPMIYSWPRGLPSGTTSAIQLASVVDIMPTVLDACGIDVPDYVQGRSLLPILEQSADVLPDNFAFIETPYREIGIRSPTALYGALVGADDRSIENSTYCYYDIQNDPFERDNVVGREPNGAQEAELRRRLLEWDAATPRLDSQVYKPWV